MNKEERQNWLKDMQDKITFARELEDWMELPITKKLIEGMIEKRIKLQKIILDILDDPRRNADDPEVVQARQQRNTIKWFLESLANTALTGERARQAVDKFEKFEKEKEGVEK